MFTTSGVSVIISEQKNSFFFGVFWSGLMQIGKNWRSDSVNKLHAGLGNENSALIKLLRPARLNY
jgi:hypothetical protein